MSLRDTFLDFMNDDSVSEKATARILLILAALAGGLTFAKSGSWFNAALVMAFAYALLWYFFRPLAEWIGETLVNALLYILPKTLKDKVVTSSQR